MATQQPQIGASPFQADQDSLNRRRALLEAMQARNLQGKQGQVINGRFYGTNIADALGQIGQAWILGNKQKALDEAQSELTKRYTDSRKAATDELMQALIGGGQGPAGVSPRQAAFAAATSPFPELQKIGQDYLSAGLKAAAPGQVMIDQMGNITEPRAPAGGGQGYDTVTIGGDLYQRTATGLKKLDNAPKVNVSVNTPISMGQKAGAMEYFKGAAKKVDALGQQAAAASDIKQTIADMKQLDENGVFSNVTTGPITFMTNLGQALGVPVDASKLGNTEAFNALSIDMWQKLVSRFGGNRGVTAEEAAQIKKMVPLAASSPQARQQLYTILGGIADRQIQQYHNADKAFAAAASAEDPAVFQAGMGGVYTPVPQEPQPTVQPSPAAAVGQPISLEDYLKQFGGQ